MAEKVTEMKLKVIVDLQCPCCYKKVKKILCKFPQIKDQVYDEKNNIVKITVVCCNPEKIRDKLCCKGRGVIKSIEIVEPPPPTIKEPEKAAEKTKGPEKAAEKTKEPEKQEEKTKEPPPQRRVCCAECYEEQPGGPCYLPPRSPRHPVCCSECYEGHLGGPCYQWYGRPVPPPLCYEYHGYLYGRRCNVTRCDYFTEESPAACSIM